MIKQYLNDSKRYLLENKKFVSQAFIVGFCRYFYITFFLAYNVNTRLTYKLNKGLSLFTIFQYFVDLIIDNHLTALAIIALIIFAIGYAFGYPIGISANIHFIQDKEKNSIGNSLGKGLKDFFSVFELNALAFSFGPYTYFSTIFRLYILDILNNGIIIGLVIIRGLCVLFSSIFRQYAKYILVLEKNKDGKNMGISEALRKSMGMTISSFGLTIKGFLAKAWTTILFYFKIAIVVAVPLLVIYFLITNGIGTNNQRIIRLLGTATMLIATFMLTSTQAFFFKFWHLLYGEAKEIKD